MTGRSHTTQPTDRVGRLTLVRKLREDEARIQAAERRLFARLREAILRRQAQRRQLLKVLDL